MTTRKTPDYTQQVSLVRVAPPAELVAYTVREHELDIIAAGSPANSAYRGGAVREFEGCRVGS